MYIKRIYNRFLSLLLNTLKLWPSTTAGWKTYAQRVGSFRTIGQDWYESAWRVCSICCCENRTQTVRRQIMCFCSTLCNKIMLCIIHINGFHVFVDLFSFLPTSEGLIPHRPFHTYLLSHKNNKIIHWRFNFLSYTTMRHFQFSSLLYDTHISAHCTAASTEEIPPPSSAVGTFIFHQHTHFRAHTHAHRCRWLHLLFTP